MRRWLDVAVLTAAVAVLLLGTSATGRHSVEYAAAEATHGSIRRPLPTPRPQTLLPPASPVDPEISFETVPKTSSGGSAVTIGAGIWVTARHVAGDCSRVGILVSSRRGMVGHGVMVHPDADLALFRAPMLSEPASLGGLDLHVGDAGYHFGFPKGEPGAARSALIGRRSARARSRGDIGGPLLAWAEIARVPDGAEPLRGISGGPTFDAAGQLVGVNVGGSRRRGRLFTTAPESLRELLARAEIMPAAEGPVPVISAMDYAAVGEQLRLRLIVVRVYCAVD